MSGDGDPGRLRWEDEDGESPDGEADGDDRDGDLCRVRDPTCEACQ